MSYKLYGSCRDNWVANVADCINRVAPFTAPPLPAMYEKVFLAWNDALYNVVSTLECIPHPMTWGDDRVKHNRVMQTPHVLDLLARYIANMTDDEQNLLGPQLQYLLTFGNVHMVQCYPSAVEISVTLNGEPRMLLINVMNMMDYIGSNNDLAHYYIRSTIN